MSTYGMREGGGAGEWIMGAVTRNPEGLLLLAAGVALLMRSGRGQPAKYRYGQSINEGAREYSGRRERSQTGEGVGEHAADAARRAGEYVSEATDKVAETARSYASSAADYADETARAAMERSTRIADQARGTADYVVREQPWAVALTGLLAGAAVAAAFRPTRLERRTLGDVGERLRSAAGAAGEQVMEAGMKAGERLTEVAEERGLTREGLKEAAREVSETFSSALAGEEKDSAQASNQTQTRLPLQSGVGTKSSTSKGNRPAGSSSGVMPEGGRR